VRERASALCRFALRFFRIKSAFGANGSSESRPLNFFTTIAVVCFLITKVIRFRTPQVRERASALCRFALRFFRIKSAFGANGSSESRPLNFFTAIAVVCFLITKVIRFRTPQVRERASALTTSRPIQPFCIRTKHKITRRSLMDAAGFYGYLFNNIAILKSTAGGDAA